ncbi:EamA family transporter [bacterium]|nr:EamA family transporter [bacterium]
MKVQSWLLLGIFTSLFWGGYIVISKLATSRFGLAPKYVTLFMLFGIGIVFLVNVFWGGKFFLPCSRIGITLAILAGALWAGGMVFVSKAINAGADVSRLVSIYNTNTLVAVLLSIIFLHELPTPDIRIRVVIGAILVVIGATLASF